MRYWSWLFAAPEAREPLLAIYALCAEWRALTSPGTEPAVARLKLAWWREEIERLARGAALHPISKYLADLSNASRVDYRLLAAAVDAADEEASGVPLETGEDLPPHAAALWGGPLTLASQLADGAARVEACTSMLAAGQYLAAAIRGYRAFARVGRVPFAVQELLAAGVDNADLCADAAPEQLLRYLDALRARAQDYYRAARDALPPTERARQRHLLVLAALGLDRMRPTGSGAARSGAYGRRPLKDMLVAWSTARGAQR